MSISTSIASSFVSHMSRSFRAFGPLRYARVTMDRDSGRSRGTGFVCFWNLDDADTCIEEADRMRDDLDPEVRSFVWHFICS